VNGSALVDTLESVERAEELKSEFKKISAKPIKAIIYTHSHKDHVGELRIHAR
jgi:glyoxylase-like metal-dependent hydrolase (beta-lactamase superfamily II)